MSEYTDFMRQHMKKFFEAIEKSFIFKTVYKDYNEFVDAPVVDDVEQDTLYILRSDNNFKIMAVRKIKEDGEYLVDSYDRDGETIIYNARLSTPLDFNNYVNELSKILKL